MRRLFTHTNHYYILCAVFFIGFVAWLPDSGFDKYFWVTWAQYIKQNGLLNAYNNPGINYHPVILFIINIFTWFFKSPDAINYTNINWLKVPTALFDWGIIFITLKLLKYYKKDLRWGLMLALNPAFWYNTIIWGQFDSIWIFFVLASFYLGRQRKWLVSVLLFILAFNTKIFALIFIPFLFPMWIRDRSVQWQFARPLFVFGVVQLLILFPFALYTHGYSVSDVITRSTDYYHSLSRNAYNIWYYFYPDPVNTPDDAFFSWLLLGITIVFAMLMVFENTRRIKLWQLLPIASLVFFLFLTRMHERYAHAALVFGAVAFFTSKKDWKLVLAPFILISIAYLFNLEAVMQFLGKGLGWNIDYSIVLFNPKFIVTLYLIALILLIFTAVKPKQGKEQNVLQ